MSLQDLHKILGVRQGASQGKIKTAYYAKALEHHPDRGGCTRVMQEINRAFEILSSEEKASKFAAEADVPTDAPAVTPCACGCPECNDFIDRGCPPGSGGCQACEVCDLPSRKLARFMREDVLQLWHSRESVTCSEVVVLMQRMLKDFVPLVLPQQNAVAELRGLVNKSELNGVQGTVRGVLPDGCRLLRIRRPQATQHESLKVRTSNLHATTPEGIVIPDFACLLGDVIRLLAPLAAKQLDQWRLFASDMEPEELLESACCSAADVATQACRNPGSSWSADASRALQNLGLCLQALAKTKHMARLDSLGTFFLRAAHASLEAAFYADSEKQLSLDMGSQREELRKILHETAALQLTQAAETCDEAGKDLAQWTAKLAELKHRKGAGEHDAKALDELEEEMDMVLSGKNDAKSRLEGGYAAVAQFLCSTSDWTLEDAVFSALSRLPNHGGAWCGRLLQVAKQCLTEPAQAIASANSLLWESLGHPDMDGIYRTLARFSASLASRGWLSVFHEDGLRAVLSQCGQHSGAVDPPSSRLFEHVGESSNMRRKMFRKLEDQLLRDWREEPTQEKARLTAFRYLDFIRLCEHSAEHVACFLNSALWLGRALALAAGEQVEKQYAIKEGVLFLCRDVCRLAKEHLHPGMQAFVFRSVSLLGNWVVCQGELADESDLPFLQRSVRNWLYAVRLCPFGVPPSILVSDAILLDIVLRQFHVAYIDGLAAMDACHPQSCVPPPVVEQARFETFAMGLDCLRHEQDALKQETARLRAVDAVLAYGGWTRASVRELLRFDYAQRGEDGWRVNAEQPKLPATETGTVQRVKEIISLLKTRRLTTDPSPNLNRRLMRGTQHQVAKLLHRLRRKVSNKRYLRNTEEEGQDDDQLVRDLERAFEEEQCPTEASGSAAHRSPLPELEKELSSLLQRLSTVQRPVRPVGRSLRGVTFHGDGRMDLMIEEVLALPEEDVGRGLFFSLDHPKFVEECGLLRHHVMQQQRHSLGDAREVVRLMHHCDYLMKELSMGVEVNALSFGCRDASALHSRLPSYLVQLLKPIHERGGGERAMHRLWLEAGDVQFERKRELSCEDVFMDTPVMRVRAHPLDFDELGSHQDSLEDAPPECEAAQFARAMTLTMQNISEAFPEFSWLSEIPKMQRVAQEILMHQDFMQKRHKQQEKVLPELLQSYREQIPQWPHRADSPEEILQKLCEDNPHATRSEIRVHQVYKDACREAPRRAQNRDSNAVEQISEHLAEFSERRASPEALQQLVRQWLDTGGAQWLCQHMAGAMRQPLDRFMKDVSQLRGRAAPAASGSLARSSALVPAAIFLQEGASKLRFVHGGVDLGSRFVEAAFPLHRSDFWRSCRRASGSCLATHQTPPLDSSSGGGGGQGGNPNATLLAALARQHERDDSSTQARDKGSQQLPTTVLFDSCKAPMSFKELQQIDPKLANSFRTRGGYKPLSEAQALYNKVPSNVRAQGADAIKEYLSTRDASHIQAKAQGGDNTEANMVFEDKTLNRGRNYDYKAGRRSSPHMSQEELEAVRRADAEVNGSQPSSGVIQNTLKTAAVAAAIEGGISALEDGVDYRKGEISGKEYATRVATKSAVAAGTGAAVSLGYTAVVTAVPVAATVLAPVAVGLAVVGACASAVRVVNAVTEHRKLNEEK